MAASPRTPSRAMTTMAPLRASPSRAASRRRAWLENESFKAARSRVTPSRDARPQTVRSRRTRMHATQASVHRRCVDASNASGARAAAAAAARGIDRARSLFVNRRGGITPRSAAVMWPSTLVRLARRGKTVECASRAIGVRCAATQGGNGAGGGDGGASVRWLGGTPQNGSNGGGANAPRGQPQAPPMRGQPQVPPPPSQGAPAVRSNGGQAGYNRPAPAGNSARMAPAAATQKPGGAVAQSAVKSKSNNGQYFATPAPVVKRSKPEEEGEYAAPENTGPPGLRDAMMESGIVLQSYTPGQHRIICPTCNGGSTGERSLAVNIEDCGKRAQWMCHRANCEWTGGTDTSGRSRAPRGSDGAISNRRVAKPKLPAPEDLQRIGPGTMTPAAAKWAEMLKQRGISLETAERNGLAVQNLYSPASSGYVDALCFPYMRGGELINIKYRGPDKTFWQVKGAEKVLYGLDDIEGEEEVIIVEGEMDKLALEEAGFKNVVSVPDGAPGKVKDGRHPHQRRTRSMSTFGIAARSSIQFLDSSSRPIPMGQGKRFRKSSRDDLERNDAGVSNGRKIVKTQTRRCRSKAQKPCESASPPPKDFLCAACSAFPSLRLKLSRISTCPPRMNSAVCRQGGKTSTTTIASCLANSPSSLACRTAASRNGSTR